MSFLGEIALNAIHIIESIEDGDYKSGKILYEDILHLSFKYNYLNIYFHEINNLNDLKNVVSHIQEKSRKNENPIIHFEAAHGNKQIFQLKDGTKKEWIDLLRFVQPVNVNTKMKFLLSIGACEGAFALSHMFRLLNEHSPCLALMGSSKGISGGELAIQYTLFYETLIKSNSLQKAWEVLKNKYPNPNDRLLFIHAPEMFRKEMKKDFKNRYSRKNFKERIESLAKKIVSGNNQFDPIYNNKSEKEIRELLTIRSQLKKEDNLKKYAYKFFLCDLYPEHEELFEVQEIINEIIQQDD